MRNALKLARNFAATPCCRASGFLGLLVCRLKGDSGALPRLLLSGSDQVTQSLCWVCSVASILNGISGRAHRGSYLTQLAHTLGHLRWCTMSHWNAWSRRHREGWCHRVSHGGGDGRRCHLLRYEYCQLSCGLQHLLLHLHLLLLHLHLLHLLLLHRLLHHNCRLDCRAGLVVA